MHTNEDPEDSFITHSPKELINYAASLGFQVLAITLHGKYCYRKSLAEYAKKKGILLIPGCEANIERKHVLLYNFTEQEIKKIKTFDDLRKYKTNQKLVVAPHSFYPFPNSLMHKLSKNIDVIDAIEYCHFYTRINNIANKLAEIIARKYNKPIISTSDAHYLWQMNTNFTFIDSKPTIQGVIQAIKKGKIKRQTRHLSLREYFRIFRKLIL